MRREVIDFNPRAHEGHDRTLFGRAKNHSISIHVPTRGTTKWFFTNYYMYDISIHVPTRGTTLQPKEPTTVCYFNPRAHEGHDHGSEQGSPDCNISIHVPTRGTTRVLKVVLPLVQFQSTCPRGARRRRRHQTLPLQPFQSTCPRGARLLFSLSFLLFFHFNPRAHEGHDKINNYLRSRKPRISIHVPTRGTTLKNIYV